MRRIELRRGGALVGRVRPLRPAAQGGQVEGPPAPVGRRHLHPSHGARGGHRRASEDAGHLRAGRGRDLALRAHRVRRGNDANRRHPVHPAGAARSRGWAGWSMELPWAPAGTGHPAAGRRRRPPAQHLRSASTTPSPCAGTWRSPSAPSGRRGSPCRASSPTVGSSFRRATGPGSAPSRATRSRSTRVRASSSLEMSSRIKIDVENLLDEVNWDYAVIERLDRVRLEPLVIPFNLRKADRRSRSRRRSAPRARRRRHHLLPEGRAALPPEARFQIVRAEGEVNTPGIYQVRPGETLRGLVRGRGASPRTPTCSAPSSPARAFARSNRRGSTRWRAAPRGNSSAPRCSGSPGPRREETTATTGPDRDAAGRARPHEGAPSLGAHRPRDGARRQHRGRPARHRARGR